MSKLNAAKSRVILVLIGIAMFVLGAGAPGMGGEIIERHIHLLNIFGL